MKTPRPRRYVPHHARRYWIAHPADCPPGPSEQCPAPMIRHRHFARASCLLCSRFAMNWGRSVSACPSYRDQAVVTLPPDNSSESITELECLAYLGTFNAAPSSTAALRPSALFDRPRLERSIEQRLRSTYPARANAGNVKLSGLFGRGRGKIPTGGSTSNKFFASSQSPHAHGIVVYLSSVSRIASARRERPRSHFGSACNKTAHPPAS